jgi:hypothetical protein
MTLLLLESWLLLIYLEVVICLQSFKGVYVVVRTAQIRRASERTGLSSEQLCRAVDLACVFYFKEVLCLQRSAVATLLLRRHGWSAEMVIGAQILPFKSHAWVELQGKVMNDKPYMSEIYQVLERC